MDAPAFNFSEYVALLRTYRRLVLLLTVLGAIAGLATALLTPPIFTATALLMPPQQSTSDVFTRVGQLNIGSSTAGLGASLGLRSQNDLYVGILRSRSVGDRIINRFDLHKHYEQPTMVDTRRMFARRTEISSTREGLIQVSFEDEDPHRAAEIANAFIDELDRLTQTLAISEAAQRRSFFERQVAEMKGNLRKAEEALTQFRQKSGLIGRMEDQGRAIIETIAGLRVQIMMREAQLAGMRTYASEANPTLTQTAKEIANLKKELVSLEKSRPLVEGDILVPTSNVASVSQEYAVKLREVRYFELALEALARQLEQARIDEGKNPTTIQAVDRAVSPDKKTRPKRALILCVSTILAFVLGCAAASISGWLASAVGFAFFERFKVG